MNVEEAEQVLADVDVIPCAEGSLADAREMVDLCLAADIPAALGAEACAKPGCTPKMQVLVREEDGPRVAALLRERWTQMVEREGVQRVEREVAPDGEPPCPACGTAAPLVAGACSDCGLQLE